MDVRIVLAIPRDASSCAERLAFVVCPPPDIIGVPHERGGADRERETILGRPFLNDAIVHSIGLRPSLEYRRSARGWGTAWDVGARVEVGSWAQDVGSGEEPWCGHQERRLTLRTRLQGLTGASVLPLDIRVPGFIDCSAGHITEQIQSARRDPIFSLSRQLCCQIPIVSSPWTQIRDTTAPSGRLYRQMYWGN